MRTSASITSIAPALIKARANFPKILRTKTAEIKSEKTSFKFTYAPLEELVDVITPALAEQGLMVMQGVEGFCLVTTVLHSSGEWISHWMEMPHAYPSPRAYGSELTFRRRYGLAAALGLAPEEDDDGQQAERDLARGDKMANGQGKGPRYSAAEEKQKIFDAMPADEQDFLRKHALNIIALLDEERADDAYGYLRSQKFDTDEQLAIQALFEKKHSKVLAEAGKRYTMAEQATARQQRKAA